MHLVHNCMFPRHLTFSRKCGSTAQNILWRSLTTNSGDISVSKRGRPPVGVNKVAIVTLDPNKFAEKKQQRLFIGNQQSFTVPIMLNNQLVLGLRSLIYDRERTYLHPDDVQKPTWHFPSDTNAFLYYFAQPERPRIAGELRLRVTSSDDPASFASGFDLLRSNGQPWSRPLSIISKNLSLLYRKLREDQLVPDDLDTNLSTFPCKNMRLRQVLYTLNDPFVIHFAAEQYIPIITEQGVAKLKFRVQFFDGRESHKGTPYTGSALVRFERSTLPEHRRSRVVVLRFLKILEPVKCVMAPYDGHIAWPREGELHQRVRKKTVKQHVWSVNIDHPKTLLRGLRLLWDA